MPRTDASPRRARGARSPTRRRRRVEPRRPPEPKERPEPAEPVEATSPERERARGQATEEVAGLLEVTPQRYGFLRLEGARGAAPTTSTSRPPRCAAASCAPATRSAGPARAPRRGERHRALVHVDRVNGERAADRGAPELRRPDARSCPKRRWLSTEPRRRPRARGRPARAAGLRPARAGHAPRPARGGRRCCARSRGDRRAPERLELIVLLVDERPEEATAWREALPGRRDRDRDRRARPGRPGARRRARARAGAPAGRGGTRRRPGRRLALAARRRGAGDVAEVKRLFGSGRELEPAGSGSLTVIATVVEGAERRRRRPSAP